MPPTTTIRYFEHAHLPGYMRAVAGPIALLALQLEADLPPSAEKSAGMRKLLEAKDCFVRAALDMATTTSPGPAVSAGAFPSPPPGWSCQPGHVSGQSPTGSET
jgi:hypothetical protein